MSSDVDPTKGAKSTPFHGLVLAQSECRSGCRRLVSVSVSKSKGRLMRVLRLPSECCEWRCWWGEWCLRVGWLALRDESPDTKLGPNVHSLTHWHSETSNLESTHDMISATQTQDDLSATMGEVSYKDHAAQWFVTIRTHTHALPSTLVILKQVIEHARQSALSHSSQFGALDWLRQLLHR